MKKLFFFRSIIILCSFLFFLSAGQGVTIRIITEEEFNQLKDNEPLLLDLNEVVAIEFFLTNFRGFCVITPEVDNENIVRSSATCEFPKLSIGLVPLSVGETPVKVTDPYGVVKPLLVVVKSPFHSDLE